jgi:hypothetical protein
MVSIYCREYFTVLNIVRSVGEYFTMLSSFSLALKIWAEGAMLPCPMLVFFQKVPYEICILVPKFAKKMPMHPLQLTKSHLAPSKLFFWLCP